jgi:protein ImuB
MFAVIRIPNFSLQAVLRHEPDLREQAIALVDPELPKPLIVQLSSAARNCGICEGLTASQATARCGELIIKSRALPLEKSATEILLQTAYAFSPHIESTAPGICTMELKGLTLHSKEQTLEQWTAKIVAAMAQFYLEAKIGLASTPELALLAARAADPILMLSSSFRKHPTTNIQHLTSNDFPNGEPLYVGCWMLVVGCSHKTLESFPISSF